MIKQLFEKKVLNIDNCNIPLKRGMYDIEELQEKFDALIVTSKLIGYDVKTFYATHNSGFFLDIDCCIHINFFMRFGVVNSMAISTPLSNYGTDLFKLKDQQKLCLLLDRVIKNL